MAEDVATIARRAQAVAPAVPLAAGDTAASSAASVGVRGRRIHFVDLLRLLASLAMVQGHTIDALLAEGLRQGPVFERWTWVRGLTSVSFMLAAGISFHLSTVARFEQHVGSRAAVRRRLRRGAWLVVLGYLLHFPAGMDAAALRDFQIVDVLQCIGWSILILEGITLIAKRPRQVVYASAALAILMLALAPLGDRLDPSGPLRFLTNYATHQGGSLFPLTPWAGFVFAGVVIGEVALPRGTRTPVGFPLPRLVLAAALVLLVAGLLELAPVGFVTEETRRSAQPAFNLTKLGVVLAVVCALALIGRRIERLPRALQILAGESLMLYVFHLLVLYGAGVGLARTVGHTLTLPAAALVAVGLIALTSMVGLLWYRVKAWRRARAESPRS